MVAQCEVGYNEGHEGPRQARLAVSKLMLAFFLVCFVIQFLGIMAYLILGLAPRASRAWSGPERREARCR